MTRVSYQAAMYRPLFMESAAIFTVMRAFPLSLSAFTSNGSLVFRFFTISSAQKCPMPLTSPIHSWFSASS